MWWRMACRRIDCVACLSLLRRKCSFLSIGICHILVGRWQTPRAPFTAHTMAIIFHAIVRAAFACAAREDCFCSRCCPLIVLPCLLCRVSAVCVLLRARQKCLGPENLSEFLHANFIFDEYIVLTVMVFAICGFVQTRVCGGPA